MPETAVSYLSPAHNVRFRRYSVDYKNYTLSEPYIALISNSSSHYTDSDYFTTYI